MADKNATDKPKSTDPATVERMQRAKATREANRKQEVSLTEGGRAVLSVVQNAGRACQIIVNRIKRGQAVSPEAVKACTVLSGEMAAMLTSG